MLLFCRLVKFGADIEISNCNNLFVLPHVPLSLLLLLLLCGCFLKMNFYGRMRP